MSALEANPSHLGLLRAQANALRGLGRSQEAEELALRRLEADPHDRAIYRQIGFVAVDEVRQWTQDIHAQELGKSSISLDLRGDFLADPEACLEPWRASLFRESLDRYALECAQQRVRRDVDQPGGELNILFVANNWNFLDGLMAWLGRSEGVHIRTLDPSTLARRERPPSRVLIGQAISESHFGHRLGTYGLDEEGETERLLRWADVIFVDWCNSAAVWLTWIQPLSARIVVRLHSYEAFKAWPLFVNWGRVASLVTVAPQVAQFVAKQIDVSAYGVHCETIANYNDLAQFGLPK